MWANGVRAAVKPYGDSMMDILEGALSIGAVSWGEPSAAAIRGGWAGSRSSRGSSRLQSALSRVCRRTDGRFPGLSMGIMLLRKVRETPIRAVETDAQDAA